MFDYIKGNLVELTPTYAVVETIGIGFNILISLQSYESIQGKENVKLYLYHHVREDDEQLFGFATKNERELFKLLINVNGIGVGTARIILSSLSDEELRNAILSEDIVRIKSIKGIGLKSAQRLILELKDKIVKGEGIDNPSNIFGSSESVAVQEASAALEMLGFSKASINKVIPNIIKKKPDAKSEDIIKIALTML